MKNIEQFLNYFIDYTKSKIKIPDIEFIKSEISKFNACYFDENLNNVPMAFLLDCENNRIRFVGLYPINTDFYKINESISDTFSKFIMYKNLYDGLSGEESKKDNYLTHNIIVEISFNLNNFDNNDSKVFYSSSYFSNIQRKRNFNKLISFPLNTQKTIPHNIIMDMGKNTLDFGDYSNAWLGYNNSYPKNNNFHIASFYSKGTGEEKKLKKSFVEFSLIDNHVFDNNITLAIHDELLMTVGVSEFDINNPATLSDPKFLFFVGMHEAIII